MRSIRRRFAAKSGFALLLALSKPGGSWAFCFLGSISRHLVLLPSLALHAGYSRIHALTPSATGAQLNDPVLLGLRGATRSHHVDVGKTKRQSSREEFLLSSLPLPLGFPETRVARPQGEAWMAEFPEKSAMDGKTVA